MSYPKPTKTFAWATAGTATAPSGGKQAAGWAVGERPPAETQNWLTQATGEWTVYANYVFFDAGTTTDTTAQTGPGIYLGEFRDAAVFLSESSVANDYAIVRMLSDNYTDLILQPDILRAAEVQVGDPDEADTGGSLIVSPTTRATPASIIRHVDKTDPADVAIFESGAFSPLSSAALVGATVPLDTVLTRENLVKAAVVVAWVRVSSANTILIGSGYNFSAVTTPSNGVMEIQLDQFDITNPARAHVSLVPMASAGQSPLGYALDQTASAVYDETTGVITLTLLGENTATGNFVLFGAAAHEHRARVYVTLY